MYDYRYYKIIDDKTGGNETQNKTNVMRGNQKLVNIHHPS